MYDISRELSLVQDISRLGENSLSQALAEGEQIFHLSKGKRISKKIIYIYVYIYVIYIIRKYTCIGRNINIRNFVEFIEPSGQYHFVRT